MSRSMAAKVLRSEKTNPISELLIEQTLKPLGARVVKGNLLCDNELCPNFNQCETQNIPGIPYPVCSGIARDPERIRSVIKACKVMDICCAIADVFDPDDFRRIELVVKAQREKLGDKNIKAESLTIKTINKCAYLYLQRWENGAAKNECVCPLQADFTPRPQEKYLSKLKTLDPTKLRLSPKVQQHYDAIFSCLKSK